MITQDQTASIFILISLFLIAIILILQLLQFIFWLTIILKTKKNTELKPTYQQTLFNEKINCQIVKTKISFKFLNYNFKRNILKLKNRDFNEATTWNKYQTLSSIIVIKWKNNFQKKRNLALPIINLFFISGVIITIICTLLYYLPIWTDSNNSNINMEVLAIFSFLALIIITMSWLFWTMFYEKFRKELMTVSAKLSYNEQKIIKYITLFKSCFPFADLMF